MYKIIIVLIGSLLFPASGLSAILTVKKAGTGSGSVTAPGITCGSDCSENFADGKIVTLSAVESGSSVFTGWGNRAGNSICEGDITCTVSMDKAHNVTARFTKINGTRYRGTNINRGTKNNIATSADPDISLSLLQTLHSYGMNLFRINAEYKNNLSEKLRRDNNFFETHNDKMINQLREVILPFCREKNIKLIYSMQDLPGGRVEKGDSDYNLYRRQTRRLFINTSFKQKYVSSWIDLANLFKDHMDVVVGLEIMNEPVEPRKGDPGIKNRIQKWMDTTTHTGLAYDVIDQIRRVMPNAPIMVSPTTSCCVGGVPKAYRNFKPMNLINITYVTHMYQPMQLTHQFNKPWDGEIGYPDEVPTNWKDTKRRYYDFANLKKDFDFFYEFLSSNSVPGIVTEFGCTRWAKDLGAFRYYRDVIDIMEGYGLNWAVHSYQTRWGKSRTFKSGGFNVDKNNQLEDPSFDAEGSHRHKLMLRWFAVNGSPPVCGFRLTAKKLRK